MREETNPSRQPNDEREYWLDDPQNVRKLYRGLWIVCFLFVTADLFYEKHIEFLVERLFGFFGFYGFVSCVFLVLAARELRKIVGRGEDYYDR